VVELRREGVRDARRLGELLEERERVPVADLEEVVPNVGVSIVATSRAPSTPT